MTSYFVPETLSSATSDDSNNGSRRSAPANRTMTFLDVVSSYLDERVEKLRGIAPGRPSHLFGRPDVSHQRYDRHFQDIEDLAGPSRFPFVRKLQEPLEERRKIPGCGINHHDIFDNPVRAETSPVQRKQIFGPHLRTYASRRPPPPKPSLSHRYGHRAPEPVVPSLTAALFESSESQRLRAQNQLKQQIRDPRYPFYPGTLSPYSSSSSSSSSSCSLSPVPPFAEFQPILESTIMRTPPRRSYRADRRLLSGDQNPTYVPSYIAHEPETYYPSPETPSLDQSVFYMTPQVTSRQSAGNGFGRTFVRSRSSSSSSTSSSYVGGKDDGAGPVNGSSLLLEEYGNENTAGDIENAKKKRKVVRIDDDDW